MGGLISFTLDFDSPILETDHKQRGCFAVAYAINSANQSVQSMPSTVCTVLWDYIVSFTVDPDSPTLETDHKHTTRAILLTQEAFVFVAKVPT